MKNNVKVYASFFNADKGGFNSKFISWFTKHKYSHVEIVIINSNSDVKGKSIHDVLSSESFIYRAGAIENVGVFYEEIGGSDSYVVNQQIINEYVSEGYDLYSIDDIDVDKLYKFIWATKGGKYDWRGLLGFISPISDRHDKWFCSEWYIEMLRLNGFDKLWSVDASRTHPGSAFELTKEFGVISEDKVII